VTQFDLEIYLRIEAALGKKLGEYPTEKEEVMTFQHRVQEAQRHARIEMKSFVENKGKKSGAARGKKGGKRGRDDMDREEG